jgi:hypothetical protein
MHDQPTPQDHHAEADRLLKLAAELNYRGLNAANFIAAAQAHLYAAQLGDLLHAEPITAELIVSGDQAELVKLRRIVAQHLAIPCTYDAALTWAHDRLQAALDEAGICLDAEVLDAAHETLGGQQAAAEDEGERFIPGQRGTEAGHDDAEADRG